MHWDYSWKGLAYRVVYDKQTGDFVGEILAPDGRAQEETGICPTRYDAQTECLQIIDEYIAATPEHLLPD